ncbi:MAG: electron transport complex subunit RsxC [Clostridiales bacterium]|nr:electron transport complex subunit RsxC [Lachnospiraceae bacterium]MCD8046288.1 electron transport complex subunit RsxC [Clostridiales bacterium]
MGLCTFKGGVHPYDGKELSKDKPITEYLPKGDLVYPLSQHIGAPAKPVVAVGDTVLAGQMIAEAGGFVSAPIYATVSGKVKKIEPRRVVVGDMVNSIVIENDGEYKSVEFEEVDDVSALSKEEILEKIKVAGVVGMGGAGFPTHVKLSPKEPDKIDYVIANCAECEPYLTSDYRRMLEEPEKLVGGMKIILSLFDNARGIIAIEDNKPDCIKLFTDMVKDEPKIEVKALRTKYPQGSERQLIYATTGRAINSTMLPADAGCIVDNTDTVVTVYNAVKLGRPLMRRIVTITGDAISEPANYSIYIGTSYAELVEAAGGFKEQPKKIISGGPMMGFAMFSLDIPTTKTTSALLCLTEDEVQQAEAKATNCINCGRCVEACPSRIVPSRLADFAQRHQEELFEKWNGLECVECGSCSYICPAKRNLVQAIRVMKKTVLANKRKKA